MRLQTLSWLLPALVSSSSALFTSIPPAAQNGTQGIDLFEIHLPVIWSAAAASGVEFVIVKTTEGANYRNLRAPLQTAHAKKANRITGAVHFAKARESSGADQANFFLAHGGNWTSSDGKTLPGVLEMEGNIAGKLCHNMNATEITDWMWDFSDTYKAATGRAPMLFLSADWWEKCAGGDESFAKEHPLWLANWADEPGPLPKGWGEAKIWQYAGLSKNGGEANLFFGSVEQLRAFARGAGK
ncbi:glycoside hydrolase superfamily [Aspergillus pseudodeflectus]|uniref:Glycoside hydrolase superfamily n=1 Tax=Aspergillus pseudodeflectus TaxID=176178 RepID=A0ABR4J7S7_9EURO